MEKSDKSIKELVQGNKVFIQVGTNIGKDFFRDVVFYHKPERTILIEPNEDLIDIIKTNYEGIKVDIENVAIIENPGPVTLYHPDREGYYHGCFSLLPMNDWEDLVEIHAEGVTINSIFEKYGIGKIDFLCVDTEGYDAIILKTIDFKKNPIDLIVFENWHFPPEAFSRYNRNWKTLGSIADEEICGILEMHGYKLFTDKDCWYNRVAIHETIYNNPIL